MTTKVDEKPATKADDQMLVKIKNDMYELAIAANDFLKALGHSVTIGKEDENTHTVEHIRHTAHHLAFAVARLSVYKDPYMDLCEYLEKLRKANVDNPIKRAPWAIPL